jgi:hemoglobin/transferrin/lactoferrin receptor protein
MQQSSNLSRFLKIGLGSTAISLIVMAGAAQAQQAKPATENAGEVQLNTINIKSVNPQEITSRPAPVSTISKTEIKLNGREKLDTVLRSTPGVFSTINGSNPGVAVNIRGFEGAGRVNMMIDGVPQSFATTGHEAQGYSYIDPNLLSSVDITRGAVTTEGGSGSAGSVNFKTLGIDDVIMDGKDKGVLGRLSWGSNGVGFSEMLAGAARVNQFGIVGAISHRDSNDYKNGDGDIQHKTGQDLISGLFKAEYQNDEHKLALGGVLYNNKYGTYQSFPGTTRVTTYDLFLQNRTFTASYNYKPTDNELIDLSLNVYHNNTKLSYLKGTGGFVGREIENQSTGFNLSNTSRFAINDVYVDWKIGVEYNHDKTGGTKVGANPFDSTADRSAVFTQAEWNYNDLQVLTGLRLDHFKLKNDADNVDNSKTLLNPKITVAYHVTDWLQPYVTYSHSMRAPSLQETMIGGTHPAGASANYLPNPNLQPEELRGWELGVNVQKNDLIANGDTLSLKAGYFDTNVKNYIVATNVAPRITQFNNIDGTTYVRGFELEANYDTGYVFAGVGYTHTKTDLPSQMPGMGSAQKLPEDTVNLRAGARFFDQKLETGLLYQHVSSSESFENYQAITIPSYDLVDFYAAYKINKNADISFKVTNLFDKEYTPALSSYGSGQGRTFVVATQFQF